MVIHYFVPNEKVLGNLYEQLHKYLQQRNGYIIAWSGIFECQFVMWIMLLQAINE